MRALVHRGPSPAARRALVYAALAAALAAIAIVSLRTGSLPLTFQQIGRALLGREEGDAALILWRIRLPRLCLSALLGGALALAGFVLQTFFQNPIAGPFVLGISSSAKLAVAATMIFLLGTVGAVSSLALVSASFLGALGAMGFLLLLCRRISSMSSLLVGGMMIGYICSALTDFFITFADENDIVNLYSWSQGSFSGASWRAVAAALVVVLPASVAVFALSKPMAAYQLGERYALSVGVNIRRFRAQLILLSSLLAACVTAFAGPISFVGIAVPQLVRRALGTARPVVVIPACFLGGAVFCTGCDLVARTALSPTELNIGTVTALFGAPVVIAIMAKRRRNQ